MRKYACAPSSSVRRTWIVPSASFLPNSRTIGLPFSFGSALGSAFGSLETSNPSTHSLIVPFNSPGAKFAGFGAGNDFTVRRSVRRFRIGSTLAACGSPYSGLP
jgi:hypothetical protein